MAELFRRIVYGGGIPLCTIADFLIFGLPGVFRPQAPHIPANQGL
jgi:hypothetical protein